MCHIVNIKVNSTFPIHRRKHLCYLHTLNREDVILLKSSSRAENLTTIDAAILGFNFCDSV